MPPKVDKIKAQGWAYKLLKKYGQLLASPVDVESMAYGEGMKFAVAPLSGCEARLVRNADGGGFARISDRIPEPGRVRFALAHEFGHFLLHVGTSQTRACTAGDMRDYWKDGMEIEANIFASELLLPHKNFKDVIKLTGPNFEEIGAIAERFNVSMTAAAIRYIDHGPIPDMVLVQIGRDHRVKWSKGKEGNTDYWIAPGTKIHDSSMAKCAFLDKSSVDETQVDYDVWFRGKHWIELTEECLYMPVYDSVLSLLVISKS